MTFNIKKNKKLLIILSERLTDLVKKGELTYGYYNPGNFFDQVHIILANDDKPKLKDVKKSVGKASLFIYNLPKPSFILTCGWNKFLIWNWIDKVINLSREIDPSLVRTYNNLVEGYAASQIAKKLKIPLIISLHTVFDRDGLYSFLRRIRRKFLLKFEIASLKSADIVIAVYKPIIRYALEHGANKVELIYNAVSNSIIEKKDYKIHKTFKIITVNRQFSQKNPENIIKAVANIDCEYWLIGNGPLNNKLKKLVKNLGIEHKVKFINSIQNEKLCKMLPTFDLVVSQSDMSEISKSTIESALSGLPILLNKHPYSPVEEFEKNWLVQCKNTVSDYRSNINKFKTNISLRRKYGKAARKYALENFYPPLLLNKTLDLFKKLTEK